MPSPEPPDKGLRLSEDERDLLRVEVADVAAHVRSDEAKAAYRALLTALDSGQIQPSLVPALQSVLEVGLESGRIRRIHTAHGEMAARRLYSRTPRGAALNASASEVNAALQSLLGGTLSEIGVSASGPGSYSLSIGTDAGRVLLRIGRGGVECQSVEVG